MTHYIHHVPGRLRIKSPVLKGRLVNEDQVIRCLHGMKGIVRTQVNPVTGSMLVFYEPHTVAVEPIIEVLREHGLVGRSRALPHSPPSKNDKLAGYAAMVLKVVAGAVVEKVAARSAGALIGAIL